jgi:sugar lactone lactonase YvrE
MAFTALAKGRYLEALAIDEHIVWFSDVILGGVQGLREDGSISHWLAERKWIGGILLNEDGSLLCSGPGGIAWINPATHRSGTLLGAIDGAPLLGVNEMCPDGRGGLIFGTLDLPAIVRGEKPSPVALYRLDTEGRVALLGDGLVFCNGLAISAEGTTLYHNESFVGTFAYDIAQDGSLENRRMLFEKRDCDGMALDVRGNLWITGFSSEELICLTPDGIIQERLALPGGACTNVRFGGPDGREIFVTTVPMTAGLEIAKGNLPTALDSVLYRGPAPLPGRSNPRTRFRLG